MIYEKKFTKLLKCWNNFGYPYATKFRNISQALTCKTPRY